MPVALRKTPAKHPRPKLVAQTVRTKLKAEETQAKAAVTGFWHGMVDRIEGSAMQFGGRVVGEAELIGFRYPVSTYEAKVSATVTRGSRIENDAGYTQLKKQGFKSVVDLTAEHVDNPSHVTGAGLKLRNIPIIDNTAPTMEQMKTFLDYATNPANLPVYVHCEKGQGRTGVAVACYRMAVQGWSLPRALREAQNQGLKMRDQVAFIKDFAKALRTGQLEGYRAR